MRAIWNCQARKGMSGYQKTCRHWNVYVGIKPNPKRIDLRCKKCGYRHQYRRYRVSTRGRKSQLRWADFPDNFPPQNLVIEANRLNWQDYSSGDVLPDSGFQTALDQHFESPREKCRAHLQKVVSPVGVNPTDKLRNPGGPGGVDSSASFSEWDDPMLPTFRSRRTEESPDLAAESPSLLVL